MIELTPKQTEAMNAIESDKFNFILYGGAIRGGKTVWGLFSLLVMCRLYPGSRWCVIREDMEKIRTTTIPSFGKLEAPGQLKQSPYEYKHPNGSVILFKSENYASDKDMDWMKGLEVNGFLFEEINECQMQTFYKAFERAGSWIIPKSDNQPKPIILATCNPTFGWVKTLVYDRWISDTLPDTWKYIPAKIADNPHLPQEYIDNLNNLPTFEYMVFVDGNWDVQLKTGGEFYHAFELSDHVRFLKYDQNKTIHLSMDQNRHPYNALGFFQLINENDIWIVKMINEIAVTDPNNNPVGIGNLISNYLRSLNYTQAIYCYGDTSTKSGNNIDETNRSFYTIIEENLKKKKYLVIDKMSAKCNHVSSIGDFVNAIFNNEISNIRIEIGENCKTAIADFIDSKSNKDGGIMKVNTVDPKTKVSYEKNGHYCDVLKDFIYQAFTKEYGMWINRFNAPLIGGIEKISRTPKFTL